jgi:hypothetical protein
MQRADLERKQRRCCEIYAQFCTGLSDGVYLTLTGYPDSEFAQEALAQLTSHHHLTLLDKVVDKVADLTSPFRGFCLWIVHA